MKKGYIDEETFSKVESLKMKDPYDSINKLEEISFTISKNHSTDALMDQHGFLNEHATSDVNPNAIRSSNLAKKSARKENDIEKGKGLLGLIGNGECEDDGEFEEKTVTE
jgi:hypothetical protein